MNRLMILALLCMLLISSFVVTAQEPDSRVSESELPWWNDRVFYEIFVRSFYDSDGDGIGDLQGVIEKLDYLNDGDPDTTDDLGVTGIWLMPVMEAPSYHGYDVTDYRKVDPDYGTNEDFRRLVNEAHERGIIVITDFVVNHTSTEHPWFQDSVQGGEHADWYVWSDTDPGTRGPSGQVVWHPADNGRYYYAVFWEGQPDLNLANPDVKAEIYDVARFWLEDMGADGFRIDGARHIIEDEASQVDTPETIAWLTDFREHVRSINPDALVVGEVWTSSSTVARYVPEALDLGFEFTLAE